MQPKVNNLISLKLFEMIMNLIYILGLNNLLKMLQNRKQIEIYHSAYLQYNLLIYYHNEILRGFCNSGNFKTVDAFKNIKLSSEQVYQRTAM